MLLQILAELGARKDNTARKHKHLLDSLAIARPVLRSQTKLEAKHERKSSHTRALTAATYHGSRVASNTAIHPTLGYRATRLLAPTPEGHVCL